MHSRSDVALPDLTYALKARLAEDPIKTPFAISIIATDEILLITLHFGAGADRGAIEGCMFQIADAFAAVERHSKKELQDIFGNRSAYR